MNGFRELFIALLQPFLSLLLYLWRTFLGLHHRFVRLYFPAVGAVALVVAELTWVIDDISTTALQSLINLVVPVLNEFAIVTTSVTNTTAIVTAYWVYAGTDLVAQYMQAVVDPLSYETTADVEVPGGITVWIVVLVALMTYAVVYHQYPTHKDWVGTVLSLVLPQLSRVLWHSD